MKKSNRPGSSGAAAIWGCSFRVSAPTNFRYLIMVDKDAVNDEALPDFLLNGVKASVLMATDSHPLFGMIVLAPVFHRHHPTK